MAIRLLVVGESWMSWGTHIKGFNAYTTGYYEEGWAPLRDALLPECRKLEYVPSHQVHAQFPTSLEALGDYNVICFSDVGSDTFLLDPDVFFHSEFRPNKLELVREFVASGGGFCMIGGYMSFQGFEGRARYGLTPISEILPVEMLPGDDRIETPQGITPRTTGVVHPVLENISEPLPRLLGYNRTRPKANGQVLIGYGTDPLLVVGMHGRGRVAAYMSDCSPHWGSREFVAWSGYPILWRNLMTWLAGPHENGA